MTFWTEPSYLSNTQRRLALPRVCCDAKFSIWAPQLCSTDSLLSKAVFQARDNYAQSEMMLYWVFSSLHVPLIWFMRECNWWRSSRGVERVGFQNCNSSQLWNRQSTCSLNVHKNLGISKPLALKPRSQFQMFLWECPDKK